MRVFAALALPEPVVLVIARSLLPLRRSYPRLRLVPAKGIHITLVFFGEIGNDAVAALRLLYEDPVLRIPAIPARLGPPGQFPERGPPRVLWVSLDKGVDEARAYWELFRGKVDPLARSGGPLQGWIPDQRGFSPHVTIGRNNATRALPRAVTPAMNARSTPSALLRAGSALPRAAAPAMNARSTPSALLRAGSALPRAASPALGDRWREEITIPPVEFLIEECVLFKSVLGPGGAEYTPLSRIEFKKGIA